jgi:hypothetical protein
VTTALPTPDCGAISDKGIIVADFRFGKLADIFELLFEGNRHVPDRPVPTLSDVD